MNNDPMGQAALDYLKGERNLKIKVHSNIAEDDIIPVNYLFRSYDQMPELERKALLLCNDKVLDVGAGAGSHALFLQEKALNVDCIDTSPGCMEAGIQRGIRNYYQADFFKYTPKQKYDTILMMMNGIGLAGSINQLPTFFEKAKELLTPTGQIILDSSDLRYLYIDEDSYVNLPEGKYYGEIQYSMQYKDHKSASFPWLFIDENLLAIKAMENNFTFEKVAQGPHFDYLARLRPNFL